MQAEFGDVNILSGMHVVCVDVILSKWRAANTKAARDKSAATDAIIVELIRINVKQCSRNFCLGTRRKSTRIKPNIPDKISWRKKMNILLLRMLKRSMDLELTANPLQYGLSLNRVFGAQNKIHIPKNAMDIPHNSWNISNTLANKGNLISNGFGRRGAKKN